MIGVSLNITPVLIIGGPAGGIPVTPAGVLRLLGGSRIPIGAIRAANGSSEGAGAAGAGVDGAKVGGGAIVLALASSCGFSKPSTYHTLNSCEYTILPESPKSATVAFGCSFLAMKLRRDQPDFELGVSDD